MNQIRSSTVTLAFCALIAVACGGGESSDGPGHAVEGSVSAVTFDTPAGWSSASDAGMKRIALISGDTSADVATGPRISVRVPILDDSGEAVLDEVSASALGSGATEFTADPYQTQVGGIDGIAITMVVGEGGDSVTQRQVIVNHKGAPYTFLLETPSEQWDEHVGQLEEILASVGFDDSQ